ncbi:thioesterase domain-containing protein, partial [Reyranella sp. CPCC 100927]|uniref:thioesterase domain-containing protein n=1 Tax=Reyranella sp. CPCC 100927 TaxID=2599616 RepID=UPI0011B92CEC
VLPALPVQVNGKVDRRALPEPEAGTGAERVGPRGEVEARLVSIWRTVLKRDDVGVTDDFFDIGGDSLRALRVAAAARQQGLASFTLEALFTQRTIAALATYLEVDAGRLPSNILPLNRTGLPKTLFCIHPGYGFAVEYQRLAGSLDGAVTLYGIQSPLYQEPDWRVPTFRAMALDYTRRIRQVQPEGPYHLLGWSSGGWVAVEIAHILEGEGQAVAFIGLVDTPADTARNDGPVDGTSASSTTERVDAIAHLLPPGINGQGADQLDARDKTEVAAILDVIDYYDRLSHAHSLPHVHTDLTVWWATRTSQRSNQDLDWGRFTSGVARVVRRIDATHEDIIRHPALADDLRRLLFAAATPRAASSDLTYAETT